MSPALDRDRQRGEAQTLSCEEGSAPLNHPHLGDLLEKFWERTMDFDFGEDFIDHLEAGDPYGRYSPPPPLTPRGTLIWRHIRAAPGSKISFFTLPTTLNPSDWTAPNCHK
jgi:hypothetical protein